MDKLEASIESYVASEIRGTIGIGENTPIHSGIKFFESLTNQANLTVKGMETTERRKTEAKFSLELPNSVISKASYERGKYAYTEHAEKSMDNFIKDFQENWDER